LGTRVGAGIYKDESTDGNLLKHELPESASSPTFGPCIDIAQHYEDERWGVRPPSRRASNPSDPPKPLPLPIAISQLLSPLPGNVSWAALPIPLGRNVSPSASRPRTFSISVSSAHWRATPPIELAPSSASRQRAHRLVPANSTALDARGWRLPEQQNVCGSEPVSRPLEIDGGSQETSPSSGQSVAKKNRGRKDAHGGTLSLARFPSTNDASGKPRALPKGRFRKLTRTGNSPADWYVSLISRSVCRHRVPDGSRLLLALRIEGRIASA